MVATPAAAGESGDNSPRRRPSGGSEVVLILTARDEGERLGTTLRALARAFPGAPVWVADDGSRDATSQIARSAGARVARSECSIGKGAAATRAARQALQSPGLDPDAVMVLCDGDLEESAALLPALVEEVRCGEGDMAVAIFARPHGGGFGLAVGFARWAIHRRCGLRLRAPISGQRALRVQTLRAVLPFAEGFGMEIGMTIDAARGGYRVREVVLELEHRSTGRTPAGFIHRARQLKDFVRVYWERR